MRSLKNICAVLACASLLFGPLGCKTTEVLTSSTQFSQSAYNTDKQIKADALALLDRAQGSAPYTGAAADVDKLMQKIDAAISSEQARKSNSPTVKQWQKVKTQLSSLFDMWKSKGSLLPALVKDAKTQVSALFDDLIATENDKRPRA
jgi:hypothetical protein